MKTLNLKGKITNGVLTLSLLFGMGLALGTTEASAQWRNDDYRRQQRANEREQRRRQREYERQQRRAEREQRRGGYGNDTYRNDGYRNDGYRGYGNRNRTRDGYGNYGGSYELRQTALNAGYNEGMKAGRKDRERGERFDFQNESEYRKATKDYNSRYGDRSTYQQYFRQAFQNGYRDGYNGNTGYGNYPYNY